MRPPGTGPGGDGWSSGRRAVVAVAWVGVVLGPLAPGAAAADDRPGAPRDPAARQETPGVAVAACRPDPGSPLLVVGFEGSPWPEGLVDEARELFRASAEADGFAVCEAEARRLPETPVLATLTLTRESRSSAGERQASAVDVRLVVEDLATRKRLSRDLDLSRFPEDTRPIALSAAATELLRASWLELAIAGRDEALRREGAAPAPEAVRRVVADEVAGAAGEPATLGLRVAFEAYGGGERHLGGDVYLTVWPLPWLGVEVEVGLRGGIPQSSRNGTVRALAALGGLGLLARLVDGTAVDLVLFLGARVAGVRFDADPAPGATGRDDAGLAATGRLGLELLHVPLPALELRLGVGAGLPFQGVAALDEDRVVTAVDDWEVYARTGIGVRF